MSVDAKLQSAMQTNFVVAACVILCCAQALAECGLLQEKPIGERPEKLKRTSEQNHNGIMLVCNKLLSARCVRQQIKAIEEQQLQARQIAEGVSSQQCSKQSTLSDLQDTMPTDRQAASNVTTGCNTDVAQPAVDSQTNKETTGAAAAISSCIR